jgi:hypothetical protein
MSNQPEGDVRPQLLTESEVRDLNEEELTDVTGGGLIRDAGHGIEKGADAVKDGIKDAGYGVKQGANAAWKFVY